MKIDLQRIFQAFLITGYPLFLYLWPENMTLFTFPIFIIFLLISLKKWNKKLGWLILSVFLTYSFFIFIFPGPHHELMPVLILIYSLVYGYLLKDLWHQIKNKRFFILILSFFVLMMASANGLAQTCDLGEGKGASDALRSFCADYRQINPFNLEIFESFFGQIFVLPPILLGTIILLTSLFHFLEGKTKSRSKKDQKIFKFVILSGFLLTFLSALGPFETFFSKLAWHLNPLVNLLSPINLAWRFDFNIFASIFNDAFGFAASHFFVGMMIWYVIARHWKFLWSKKLITIPTYILLMILNYFLFSLH